MDADTIFKLGLLVFGGGIAVKLFQISAWVGELRTKVDVMWHAFTNDLEMPLQKRLEERKKQEG
jgi:hypothetical protein